MKIELKEIKIKELVDGYVNNQEEGVVGFSGQLNIRPKYQREFIYKDKQRDAVIRTVRKDFPLNTMYWVKNKNSFEVLDGQQRTISICEYVNGGFAIDFQYFHNLTNVEQKQILDYQLMIYFCEGDDKEKLDWFRIINIAGEKLTDQELRNAIYTGEWLSDAKRYFSRTGCPAYGVASDYVSGSPIRQDYLETVIDWISDSNIENYMAEHQHNNNASDLWQYFQTVINWTEVIFPNYRREMKGINWGELYNKFKDTNFNADKLESKVAELLQDDDVTKKSGIYEYVLTGEEKYLQIRAFTQNQKREAYERQDGICVHCEEHFDIDDTEADHITPWSEGGKTIIDNCQILCKKCNRKKSNK